MPPLLAASSWTTMLRSMLNAARSSATPAARAKPSGLPQAKRAVRELVHSTYHSLATPALQPALQPARLAIRPYPTLPRAASTPYAGIRTSFRLNRYSTPHMAPTGPAAVATVGLASARSFGLGASRGYATAAASAGPSNIPIVCRTFMPYLADEERLKTLPKGSLYWPYAPRRQRKMRRSHRSCWKDSLALLASIESIDTALVQSSPSLATAEASHSCIDYRRYFQPAVTSEVDVCLPLKPEQLVTPGRTTVLAVPLSEDLSDILLPTPQIPYRDAEIGVTIFGNIVSGLLPIHEALMLYGSTHIHPLVAKLDSLGLWRSDADAPVQMMVGYLGDRPDILRLVFVDRSEMDVKELLGETLGFSSHSRWFTLYERSHLPAPVPDFTMEESAEISAEAEWRSASSSQAQRSPRVNGMALADAKANLPDLRMPEVDASGSMLASFAEETAFSDEDDDPTPPELYSWPSSGTTSPIPADLDMTSVAPRLPPLSLLATAPLFDYISPPASTADSWSADLSDSDSEIESALEISALRSHSDVESWSSMEFERAPMSGSSRPREMGPLMPW